MQAAAAGADADAWKSFWERFRRLQGRLREESEDEARRIRIVVVIRVSRVGIVLGSVDRYSSAMRLYP